MELYQQARALQPELVQWRRDIHQHPELAEEEFLTAAKIEGLLDEWKIPHERIGRTGVLGLVRGELPGDGVVALRADIDALPIQEANDLPYRSQCDGVMHACGHDAHTACLLGGAKLLSAHRAEFGGTVKLIFQPGEEVGKGAGDFIRAGIMDDVQRVFGLHVAHEYPAGTVSVTPGLNNAAVDKFRIVVKGRSSHVSRPQEGADALYIASHIVVALQSLVTRRTSPIEPTLIGIGKLHSGTTYNAIAEEAELEGTTRTVTPQSRARLKEQIIDTAKSIAAIYGGSVEVEWTGICSAQYNDAHVAAEVRRVCGSAMPGVRFTDDRPVSLGGDNYAEFCLAAPGAYAYLGSSDPDRPETRNSIHNSRFNLVEDILPIGAALYAVYAHWWLTEGSRSTAQENG